MPGPLAGERLDQLPDAPLKVHSVAQQALVVQEPFGVVVGIQEDPLVGRVVRSSGPGRKFLLVAYAATFVHAPADVALLDQQSLGHLPAKMPPELADVVQMEPDVRRENAAVAFLALHGTVR